MGGRNSDLDDFLSRVMEEEALPVIENEKQRHKNVWSYRSAEVTEGDFCWFMEENAGPPKVDGETADGNYWFVFSDSRSTADAGILFWQKSGRHFARRLRGQEWQAFLTAAGIKRTFWRW